MTQRLLKQATRPFSENIKRKMRTLFKQDLNLPRNASDDKLAQTIGVERRFLYDYLALNYNNYVESENKRILQQRKEENALQRYGKRLEKTILNKDTFTREIKNDEQFNVMLNKIQQSGKKFIISWDGKYYALSDKKINDLREHYKKNKSYFIEENEQLSSDEELLYNLKNKKIKFRLVDKWATNEQDTGAFFNKHHMLPFDLSDYQIYTETKNEHYENADACFIHALKIGGLEEKKLNIMRSMVKTKNLPKCMLGQLCEKVKIQVHVKMMHYENKKEKRNVVYGKEGETFKIGLINNHYFLIKPMELTRYAIENFDNEEFTKIKNWQKKVFKGGRFQQDKNKFIDSFTLIKIMVENEDKYLKPMSLTSELYKTTLTNQFNIIENLEYDNNLVRENEPKKQKEKEDFVNEYFDFETTTDGETHRPYLARVAGYNQIFLNTNPNRKEYDKWIGYQMLKFLVVKNNYKNIRLYAHNAGYDIKFIFNFIKWDKIIERGHSLLRAYGKFYYEKGKFVKIEVQDTKAYLTCQLKNFKDMFNLPMKKEIIPYRMYNEKTMSNKNVWEKGLCIEDIKKFCQSENVNFDEFMKNANEWNCVKDNYVNIIEYSSRYCQMDCELLKNGWETFRKWIINITGLDVHDYISISSLVDNYFRNEEVYKDVYEVSCYVREFIQRCMVGGRTMCRKNKKYHLKNTKINDFDAVSLYPSAMQKLGGYLKGPPKVLSCLKYETLKTYDGYFVEIKINKINKKRAFPLMSYKNSEGIREFSNDMEGKIIYVDKFMLEDMIEFHDITFDIIRGYYYDEGRNMKLKTVIEYLFNERLKAKKNKNPIEVVYKLMMNASYGKTLMKPFNEDSKIMSFQRAKTFITRQYNKIVSIDILSTKKWDELNDNDNIKIKIEQPIINHFNNAPCGCEVLSVSKRIMNEVMNTAEDNNLKIYYQDTDSMHINDDDIKTLSETYEQKYGRKLIGKAMGQFHSDFSSNMLKGDVYACESIFLGKKCYIDKLTDDETKDENGNPVYDYHIRMKGMGKIGIVHRANQTYDGDIMKVYEHLFKGDEIEFDLCGGGIMPTFDYNSNGTISSKMEFIRRMKF